MEPVWSGNFDLTPLPMNQRIAPARIQNISVRLMLDQHIEHRHVADFITQQIHLRGRSYGSRLIVNSLLHYRDTIVIPLQSQPELIAQSPYDIARATFTPVQTAMRQSPPRVKSIGARMYIDQFAEHRQVVEFLQSQQETYGDGLKTIVRAMLNYRKYLAARAAPSSPMLDAHPGQGQLSLEDL